MHFTLLDKLMRTLIWCSFILNSVLKPAITACLGFFSAALADNCSTNRNNLPRPFQLITFACKPAVVLEPL